MTEYRPLKTSSASGTASTASTASSMMSSMCDSKYSRVIFTEMGDTYAPRSGITCRIYSSVVMQEDDQITIQQVASQVPPIAAKKLKDMPAQEVSDFGERLVVFSGEELPEQVSEDDFFQFCYLQSQSQEVCGASTPFRFRTNEDQLDEDFLVVTSPEALLQQRVEHLLTVKATHEEEVRQLKTKLDEKEEKLSEVEVRLKEEESKNKEAMDQLLLKEKQLEESRNGNRLLNEEVLAEKKRREQLEMSMAHVKMERDRTNEEVVALRAAVEQTRRALESQLNERQAMERKTAAQKVQIEELHGRVGLVEAREELMKTQLAKELSERRDREQEMKSLKEELVVTKKAVEELTEKKEILMKELLEEDKTRLKTKVQMKSVCEERDALKEELKRKTSVEEEMESRAQEMRHRLERAAEEYGKVFRNYEKMVEKHKNLKSKVKLYFDNKSKKSEERNQLMEEIRDEEEAEAREAEVGETSAKRVVAVTVSEEPSGDDQRLPCVVCGAQIDGRRALVAHLEERHAQRLCPVCALPFDVRVSGHHEYFRMHVENHLESGYPHK